MRFNSLQYAVFLPLAIAAFWAAPVHWRVHVLVVASYVFYATWSLPYAAMMFILAVANYFFGRLLGAAMSHRGWLLATFVSLDLGVLALFKYWNFISANAALGLASVSGRPVSPVILHVVLPLGISFFTFEFIHYLVDIYQGALPVHSFTKFHSFVAFFPTQIAGPIKRFQQFVPNLMHVGRFDRATALEGLWLIGQGLCKKVLLADNLAPIANAGFDAAGKQGISSGEAWVATLAFSLQIFFDFSGYTDIARGSAQLFGFRIPINFAAPYLASSVSDFWHRWHISLSTWLRDYLYIPLGGSRHGLSRTLVAVMITMALGGLWHGAAWHFVLWGIFWGAALCLHRLLQFVLPARGSPATTALGWALTQTIVLIGWVLFRAGTVSQASRMLAAMFSPQAAPGVLGVGAALFVLLVGIGLLAIELAPKRAMWDGFPAPWRPALAGIGLALVSTFVLIAIPPTGEKFIYFQF